MLEGWIYYLAPRSQHESVESVHRVMKECSETLEGRTTILRVYKSHNRLLGKSCNRYFQNQFSQSLYKLCSSMRVDAVFLQQFECRLSTLTLSQPKQRLFILRTEIDTVCFKQKFSNALVVSERSVP